MKFVKNYENVMQKIIIIFDKLSIIDVDISSKIIIVDTFSTFNQKKKFERSSKLSTTIFKSLIIIDDTPSTSKQNSSIVVVSWVLAKLSTSISIIAFASSSNFATNIFSLVSTKQKLAVVIFFKQVLIDLKPSTMSRKPLALK